MFDRLYQHFECFYFPKLFRHMAHIAVTSNQIAFFQSTVIDYNDRAERFTQNDVNKSRMVSETSNVSKQFLVHRVNGIFHYI